MWQEITARNCCAHSIPLYALSPSTPSLHSTCAAMSVTKSEFSVRYYNRYKVSNLALDKLKHKFAVWGVWVSVRINPVALRNNTNKKNEIVSGLFKMAVLSRFRAFLRMYPVTRGMITYSMIWPTSCLIQQTVIEGKNYKNYNYWAAARFSIYGGLFVAPTLYCWIRLSTFIWPKTSLRTAVAKVRYIFTYSWLM